jgi:hypothetical protein
MKSLIMILTILAIMVSAPLANARDASRDWLMHIDKEQLGNQQRWEAVWHARTPAERAEAYQNYVYNLPELWAPIGN